MCGRPSLVNPYLLFVSQQLPRVYLLRDTLSRFDENIHWDHQRLCCSLNSAVGSALVGIPALQLDNNGSESISLSFNFISKAKLLVLHHRLERFKHLWHINISYCLTSVILLFITRVVIKCDNIWNRDWVTCHVYRPFPSRKGKIPNTILSDNKLFQCDYFSVANHVL